jgi:TolB protein
MITGISNHSFSQDSIVKFEGHNDIVAVKLPGDAFYNAQKDEYIISGSGYNIWFDKDEFHFLWKKIKGDFIVSTKAEFIGEGVDPHRKIGWMARATLDNDAPHVIAVVHGDGLSSLQFRRNKAENMEEMHAELKAAQEIQLERKGNIYTVRLSKPGEPEFDEKVELDLGEEIYIGLFISSHNEDVLEKAKFGEVSITIPTQ